MIENMRVLVATDRIGALSSARAGEAVARGWLRGLPGSQLAVVPIGESGQGFVSAYAEQLGADAELVAVRPGGLPFSVVRAGERMVLAPEAPVRETHAGEKPEGIDYTGTSLELGLAAADALRDRPRELVLDLASLRAHDAGAGFLAGLGAVGDRPLDQGVAGLAGIGTLDLRPVIELVGETTLTAVVPTPEAERQLLGLRGITSWRGRASGEDPARLLATDATLEAFTRLCNREAAGLPGAGACGAAYAVLALGGRILTGPQACGELAGLERTLAAADLVVGGVGLYDFASRGGGVLSYLAERAAAHLRPCIAVAGEVVIGTREMRSMGIEAAYPVHRSAADRPGSLPVSATELEELAARVARSWAW